MSERISFVRPRCADSTRYVPREGASSCEEKDEYTQLLSGDEMRRYYEEVVSTHEEREALQPLVKDQSRRTLEKVRPSKQKVKTPCEIFLYAQNNELDKLMSALANDNITTMDMQDSFLWTPLMMASYAGHVSIVNYLLHKGARWSDIVDKKGRNAADLAVLGGHPHIAEMMAKYDTSQYGESTTNRSSDDETSRTLPQHRVGRSIERYQDDKSFYCVQCQLSVKCDSKSTHNTSTTHLFSCQHRNHGNVSYGIHETNKGFQLLLQNGWDPEKGLGPEKQGKRFPVKTVLKQDRRGFGMKTGKPRITHFSANDVAAIKLARNKTMKVIKKKDILEERRKDRLWERRLRTSMNS